MSKSYKHMSADAAERTRNVKDARRSKNLRSNLHDTDFEHGLERAVQVARYRAPRNKSIY